MALAGYLPQKFLLIHVVFECFPAVDHNDRHLVVVTMAEFVTGVHVNLTPSEAAAFVELDEALLDDFAEMTAPAGVNDYLAPRLHREVQCSSREGSFQARRCKIHGMAKGIGPLIGKVVLVTGAAKRLGRAIALAAADNGADVAITFHESEREASEVVGELAKRGAEGLAVRCDITDEKNVSEMVKEVAGELGGIDVLVNNAANYETAEFEKLTVEQWDAIFASNTRGPFVVSREALPYLRQRKGKIIHMGSLGGLRPWATHAHYCSSKAALHMLTKVMAKALAPEIAVNAVAPGMIDLGEKSAAAFMRRMAKETPMRRNGTAAEIAAAVMFFATAPHFITGQIMAVDGGLGL